MRARPLALATAALFVLSVLGIVVVDEGGGTVVSAAAAATTRTGSARMETTTVVSVSETVTTSKATGVVDFGSGRSQVTTVTEGIGSQEVIGDGKVVYLKAAGTPFVGAAQGKPWVSLDLSALGEEFAALAGNAADPGSLEALSRSGFVRDLEEEGTDEVRGVRTVRWSGRIDAERFQELLAGITAGLGASAPALEGLRSDLTAWISDDGLVRRSEVTVSARIAGAALRVVSTTELFDFGHPVRIEVPPPDQVHPVTSLQELTGE